MPELPEVETVKEALIHHAKMIKTDSANHFKNKVIGQKFIDIKRRGKYLIFELTDYDLLSHLRMEGKFFYDSQHE